MAELSESEKAIAQFVGDAFGGPYKTRRYADEAEEAIIRILRCPDRPQKGVTSFGTLGLSDVDLEPRVELVGACGSSFEHFDNALATAAFNVINSGWDIRPGASHNDVLAMYDVSETMQHLYFMPPFLWEDKLKATQLAGKTIAWLLAVPVSESELSYLEGNGPAALEQLFVQKQIDIFDLNREPVA